MVDTGVRTAAVTKPWLTGPLRLPLGVCDLVRMLAWLVEGNQQSMRFTIITLAG
jgi:hypothetical protein